ncbi:MAG: GNAT family N-acetyltransferase [Ruminococcaceae bacterium]|nr:GNAT family N-acetyltransferase [Oscillospiraceae bacterium]
MIIKEFSPKDFDKLEPYWRELECGEEMTAFQTYDWYRMVNQNYLQSKMRYFFKAFYILVLDQDGTPVMIAPLMLQKIKFGNKFPKAIYFLGRETCTDYFSFIYKVCSIQAIDACFTYIKNTKKIRHFVLTRIREESTLYCALNSSYKCVETSGECVALYPPATFEELTASWKKNFRNNYRNVVNRMHTDGVQFNTFVLSKVSQKQYQDIMTLHQERKKNKQKAAKEKMSFLGRLYNRVIDFSSKPLPVLAEYPNLWIILTYHEERLIAFFYGPYEKDKKTVRLLFTGVSSNYYKYSIGINQLMFYLKESYDTLGHAEELCIDFTRGAEEYKSRIGGKLSHIFSLDFEVN